MIIVLIMYETIKFCYKVDFGTKKPFIRILNNENILEVLFESADELKLSSSKKLSYFCNLNSCKLSSKTFF